jgi:hypothetical protein
MRTRPFEIGEQAVRYLRRSRVQLALSRAAATAPIRELDPSNPRSWEFSAFSAAGEDGIIDYLTRRLREPEHVFLEVGASDGVANNTAWLAIGRKWQGVMIDADTASVRRARTTLEWFNPAVRVLELTVTEDNVDEIMSVLDTGRPDVFSLDVDSVDYYIARSLFANGLRPGVCVVEYNSAYGPDWACTVNPSLLDSCREPLYYGVSIAGWRRFFAIHGYQFVGVEATGVNAFFADRERFDPDFLDGIHGDAFRENVMQRRATRTTVEQQSRALEELELVGIP